MRATLFVAEFPAFDYLHATMSPVAFRFADPGACLLLHLGLALVKRAE
jgi:hypothetical protein